MPGPPMPGMERRRQFDRDGRWAGWIRNDAGDASGWHHHAANDTYVYVSRGSLTIDFGPGGADSIVARAGDFIFVPSRTIANRPARMQTSRRSSFASAARPSTSMWMVRKVCDRSRAPSSPHVRLHDAP
jgi:uncharacterized RmlC-like cupin family protein